MRIAEAAHAAHHAEVVVERPVLLHQHDDVLDVLAASGSPGCAGIASARAMLSDSIVAATLPPASWRNLRRLTSRMSITSLVFTGSAHTLP